MNQIGLEKIVTQNFLDSLLPPEKSDQFFEALYGDASEGAYDIRLECLAASLDRIVLAFNLVQRPGKCLVCNLTYGLPTVFQRHPLINIKGMVDKIEAAGLKISSWRLGETEENTSSLHVIPLYLNLTS
ncbi:MAG: pancreas/duodenum homeobox protein 1 [Deltaproteobacteria bacterium]|nr:MAG: pancreas/duodenum homeobox protein 1 [Deltaproteobacteria bacterium]